MTVYKRPFVSFQHGDFLESRNINSSDKDEEVQQSEYDSSESDSDNEIEQESTDMDYQCIDMKDIPECLSFMWAVMTVIVW